MPDSTPSYFAPTLYRWRIQALEQALAQGADPLGVDWLLREVGGIDRLQLRLLPQASDRPLALACTLEHLDRLWRQHLDHHTPVQYLAGFTHWWRFRLQVSPAVLIPRPETELLVDWVEQWAQQQPHPPRGHWADLGTGSGSIALGLATILPQAQIHGVDCSAAALAIAQSNAQSLGLSPAIQWHHGHWFKPLENLRGQLQGIVANPPYIPTATIATLDPEVQHHEPHLALDGGQDGLDDLRHLITTAADYLQDAGVLVLEMMAGQGEAVRSLLHQQGSYRAIEICNDLSGLDRFAVAQRHQT
ncbi:peptide chain release factor N(5)-glutamine methyltransferase [Prochlorothrix hollandica]|uniref:Release factor glutamine methyltransferase n=1 Tax=Prochlorothrix hollandica PCC 9006 = CALU 1027 TaxID=317619 RepID=A0A0M2Q1B6_PROHO|nr:peptide chain release factor N(5)-glutamine methyltransferase [Prochlorothrix hollandica]KKJ01098.1 SAM-dependent methyltransferase [Prochlorothrix hollandica PCC 9006 = CALU 1027]